MKNVYVMSMFMLAAILSGQTTISFEESEGYALGNLHAQNNWEVTESSDGVVQNQVISDEQASEGTYSFKNGYEPSYDFQWFPIFGGSLTFEEPIPNNQSFSLSYDVMVTATNGADFEFTMYGINDSEEFSPVAGVGIENRGYIYLIKDDFYDFDYAESTWEAGEWINIKVEVSNTEIKYYVNNVLETTLPKFNDLDVHGINFLHNNYGEDAYYDNIQITMEDLSTSEHIVNHKLALYPNPVIDILNVSVENQTISSIEIYDNSGKLLLQNKGKQEINLSKLPSGMYFLKISTQEGENYYKKVLKK